MLSELFKRQFLKLEQLIIEFVIDIKYSFDKLISDTDNLKLNSFIEKVEGQSFKQLDVNDINELLHIKKFQFKRNIKQQFQVRLDKIQQQLNLLKNDYFVRKYFINKVYEGDVSLCIDSSIISNNERFLVYNKRQVLNIYDIKLKKNYKKIKNKSFLIKFQFTSDNKYLFAASYKGFVYGFLVQNDFKNFYKQKILKNRITEIITYKQYLITAGWDNAIIKTDFLNKQQICKLVGHSNYITCIDYDHQRDIIISSSEDMSVKMWSCTQQKILIERIFGKYYQILQLQFINNCQNILGLDNHGNLWKWQIDMCNNKLIEEDQFFNQFFRNNYQIYRFQSINNGQNLLLICYNNCLIFNNKDQLIKKIENNFKLKRLSVLSVFCPKQLDNLNYIVLHDDTKINLVQVEKLV